MNIGIDIDDTITNTYETLIPMIAIKYGMNLNKILNFKPSYKILLLLLPLSVFTGVVVVFTTIPQYFLLNSSSETTR